MHLLKYCYHFRLFVLALLLFPVMAHAKVVNSEQEKFKIETVTSGLVRPWSLAFLPNGDFLITERPGKLRLVKKNGQLVKTPIKGLPKISAGGQGGLLDVILHPDYQSNNLIYFSYAASGSGGIGTQVAKAKFMGDRLEDVKIIFKALPKTRNRFHFGSRLAFDNDKKLYITIGEKFAMRQAQNLQSHLGSIVRLNEDGTVPKDNPFLKQAGKRPEIFSYGHRNPQGLAKHPVTGKIWAHEHGPRGGDEVNIIKPGANYGWPKITYGIDYSGEIISNKTHAPGMEQPVVYWDPSIAPSGMAFYTGDKFSNWKGDLFVGALAHLHLRRLELEGDQVVGQEVLLQDLSERIRDVRSGPDGYLYVLTDSRDGKLLRLKPN